MSSAQPLTPGDMLRVNSLLLRAFPWHTGAVLNLPRFLGNVGDDNLMVRQMIHTHLSDSFKNQGFLSTLDRCETTIFFTMGASSDPQDHDVQSMLGIKVTVEMVDKPHTSRDHSGDQPCDISGDSSST